MSRGAFSPPGFQLALGLKDIRLVPRTADQLGVPMPVAGVAYDHFLSAASRGRGGLDWTAVSEVVREAAGLAPAWGVLHVRPSQREVRRCRKRARSIPR